MPALNFQGRFAAPVEHGSKRQTIRRRRKDGRDPKPGDRLVFYRGQRTPACRRLGEAVCTRVTPVAIGVGPAGVELTLDDRLLSVRETEALARADGFADAEQLRDWFAQHHGLPFEGLLIEWGAPT